MKAETAQRKVIASFPGEVIDYNWGWANWQNRSRFLRIRCACQMTLLRRRCVQAIFGQDREGYSHLSCIPHLFNDDCL